MDALQPGERSPGNMFVPIDLLKPALEEMVKTGAQQASRRPWLGVNSLEEDGRVKVMQVNEESPADQAGIAAGDIILSVNGLAVDSLEAFYNKLWDHGAKPGNVVKLTVLHGPVMKEVDVRSIDRIDFMRHKQGL
jgi:S1-C subfamily serine protease